MSSDHSFALLLTWTCYGTWLPGDRRGYVSNTLLPEGGFRPKQNRVDTPYMADDRFTRRNARRAQKQPPARLNLDLARTAAASFLDAARQRAWNVARGAVMANHVHLVVLNCVDDGPQVRRVFKGVSSAALCDHARIHRRWWTSGGSDRYLHGEEAILAAIRYVASQRFPLVEIIDMTLRVVDPQQSDPAQDNPASGGR
jgi:REP element-mobilizing transposase RayT